VTDTVVWAGVEIDHSAGTPVHPRQGHIRHGDERWPAVTAANTGNVKGTGHE
jgi:hypothetical protein